MSRVRRETELGSRLTRCAIYTRKSSEEGLEQEFNSLDAQRESAEAFITSQKAEGWVCLSDRYDDGGYTGGNMERPAVKRLMTEIDAGKIDCVVVYKVDRLSRSLLDFARMMEAFDKHNVSFVSVTQQFNTATSMGRLVLNVLLSFAQFEREIIGERIRDKKAAQSRRGKWPGGAPVLGYDVDRSGPSPKLVVNSAEAARIRQMFQSYLDLGSLLAVVRDLTHRGWHNKKWTTKAGRVRGGLPFDKSSLHGLLTNPIYMGKIRYKRELHPGEHEAIVEPEVFAKVGAMLRYNGRSGGIEVRNRYGALLKRLLYCAACGKAMVHTFSSKRGRQYRYYTCVQAIKKGWDTCPSKSVPAGEIEQVVVDQIRGIGRDPALLAEVLKQANVEVEEDLAAVKTEKRDLERELARQHEEIRTLAVEGYMSTAAINRIADLHARVRQGEERLAAIKAKFGELKADPVGEEDVAAAFANFDNIWDQLTPRERAKVVSLMVARVEYDGAESTVSVTFHASGVKHLPRKREEAA